MTKSLLPQRRRRSIIDFPLIRLDRAAPEPLHQQLCRQIRQELASGNFGDRASRLPSSRALAADLRVSRETVDLAFAKLHAEGYLQSRIGSGTFVADPLPETFLSVKQPKTPRASERPPRMAERLRQIHDRRGRKELDVGRGGGDKVSLRPGLPAVDEFPIDIWERLRAETLAKKGANLLRYATPHGDLDLREAVAAYLCDSRGARCHAEQIVIVGGMQQAMAVSALALLDPGDTAWIEDPGFVQARRVFGLVGASVVPRSIDREGIVIARSSRLAPPKMIFVTPSHQFPLGVTMSLARRIALIDFARKRDAFIFEDDYNSEFRFNGPPLPCLQGLDDVGRVIYAGTMSKILFPSLRLGYLVVPEPLVDSMIKIRAVMDQHSSAIDQATLARFLTEGFFLSHVKRMRKLYGERREYFVEQFNKYLGEHLTVKIPEAGLHFVARLRRKSDFPFFVQARSETGIVPTKMSFYCIEAKAGPTFLFGFAAWSPAQIREGLAKLALAFERLRKAGESAANPDELDPRSE
ncbi:MAG TPA: PLP-dependent aminotransferase family protein [Chthoniobacterales bacterium]|nr:PLP-dependent aminotransferase family protein [Chthoniobacterales bacterium]